MLLYDVRKQVQGFTLFEMLLAVTIAGILAAIATPNWLSWYTSAKVKSSLEQVHGALTQAQRQAMRRGKSCTITLDTTNNKVTTTDAGCLLSDYTLQSGVVMTTNISSNNIKFSLKGSTTISDLGVIVLAKQDGSGTKRCLVVSTALGTLKTGTYNGTNPSSPSSSDCDTSD